MIIFHETRFRKSGCLSSAHPRENTVANHKKAKSNNIYEQLYYSLLTEKFKYCVGTNVAKNRRGAPIVRHVDKKTESIFTKNLLLL